MGFDDKLKEYKERQEAKRYFRSQNDQFLNSTQWIKTIGIGGLASIASGIVLGIVIYALGITSSFFYIIAGFVVARVVVTISGIQSQQMAILSVILTFICFVVGEMTIFYLPFYDMGIGLSVIPFFELLIASVKGLFIGDLFTTICVFIGMIIAYQQAQ